MTTILIWVCAIIIIALLSFLFGRFMGETDADMRKITREHFEGKHKGTT